MGTGGWIILRWILGDRMGGGIDWIGLAQNGDQWRVLVNMVRNLWAP
jgi:hypothetical protein